jgi:hypothetical protein
MKNASKGSQAALVERLEADAFARQLRDVFF